MGECLLSVERLKTYFNTLRGVLKAVDGVSLKVNKKESVALVGESGCGKSMTAFSIMRLVPPPGQITGGKIVFKRKDLLQLSNDEMRKIRGREISMVFQDPLTFLNPVMRIGDQIAESVRLHQQCGKDETRERVLELLESVFIASPARVAAHYPHQLSGGMRQRVVISIALSCNPSLLIADEPSSALDVTVQAQVMDLIKQLTKKRGTSLLLITHDLGVVADVCDEVYVMYAGEIVETADVYELFENPAHPYTRGLLDSVLSIDQFKKTLVSIDGVVPDLVNPPRGCRFKTRCNKYIKALCEQEPQPVLIEKDHMVRCWLHNQGG
jgi:peptide/nickel transport system ATP-binding protein